MGGEPRSRSPRARLDSERISRIVAGFGRYPDKRPIGLRVNTIGAMTLESLMDSWADNKGLSEREVMDAVRLHMFQRHGGVGGAALRFAVTRDEEARILIRAMPRSQGGGRDGDFDDDVGSVVRERRPRNRALASRAYDDDGGERRPPLAANGGGQALRAPAAQLDFSAYPRNSRAGGATGSSAEVARLAYS
eukprot:CAMPEP_0204132160 /NCGR_PEP_ID=MMETSP0361-20130328/14364_1 /ASSEMBLY_ACC=CAM_ASM_000343 /TAXON_ID=268821 /ORGANISM="Scrippsiella Hangoei, Strain SHTV-5" /LENGTH=191 /DNA_ID=CAMNT_0051085021 /DNA_START=68 /DNA_END=640 /DNA_ORIENTATION=+